jgi:collagenase-like PrtC family protease
VKLSVPTNLQDDFLNQIDFQNVSEIYGKLEKDVVGGGRASVLIPDISGKEFRNHVRQVHSRGPEFNYLLNATCLNNREWTYRGQKKIRRFLDWLSEIEVDSVTVAIPYLLQLIKQKYSRFKVHVSVQAMVNTPLRAKYWEDLGADQITLSCVDVNRNFRLLKEIRESVKIPLQLIANLSCLSGCPFVLYHGVLTSHSSQKDHFSRGFYIDYCSLSCRMKRTEEPWRLIASGWIRPEDLKYYEEAGMNRIKLVDRIMKTDVLHRLIGAYSRQRYDGNLLDLFPSRNNDYIAFQNKYRYKLFKYFFRPFQANVFRLFKNRSTISDDSFFLDNRKMDGFIDFFINGHCRMMNCNECGYCRKTAKKALYVTKAIQDKRLHVYRKMFEDLITGKAFYMNVFGNRKKNPETGEMNLNKNS